ncbi:MAG: aspartate-semialdehyde dehydrogenase [bacterium]
MVDKRVNVAIVGATGLVGSELIEAMSYRGFPVSGLRLFASPESAGESMEFQGEEFEVELLSSGFAEGMDLVFFAAPSLVGRDLASEAAEAGAVVIDSSGAFRGDPSVPLVVPDLNAEAMAGIWQGNRIVSSPSSQSVVLALVLAALERTFHVKRVSATLAMGSTSGGRRCFEEHQYQTIDVFNQNELKVERFPRQSAFNIFPQAGEFEGGHSQAERELMDELPRILGRELPVAVTAMQAPVFCGLAASLSVGFDKEVSADKVRESLSGGEGLHVLDDPANEVYPDTMEALTREEVLVGRVRKDPTDPCGVLLWVSADNLRKGSSLNMLRIAELVLKVLEKAGGAV